jgi:hypothetical protein
MLNSLTREHSVYEVGSLEFVEICPIAELIVIVHRRTIRAVKSSVFSRNWVFSYMSVH